MTENLKLFACFALAFLLNACTISHFNKTPEGEYDASNYSLFMDRENVDIATPNTSVKIGSSKSSDESLEKVKEGLTVILESIN